LVKDGDYVEKDQAIAELTDKSNSKLPAEASGIITLKAEEVMQWQ
jgi:2-oxoglutarate dehydrogenase E2 component (dihydrolipoamide succinyltransferase)